MKKYFPIIGISVVVIAAIIAIVLVFGKNKENYEKVNLEKEGYDLVVKYPKDETIKGEFRKKTEEVVLKNQEENLRISVTIKGMDKDGYDTRKKDASKLDAFKKFEYDSNYGFEYADNDQAVIRVVVKETKKEKMVAKLVVTKIDSKKKTNMKKALNSDFITDIIKNLEYTEKEEK